MAMRRCSGLLKRPEILETVYSVEEEEQKQKSEEKPEEEGGSGAEDQTGPEQKEPVLVGNRNCSNKLSKSFQPSNLRDCIKPN